MKDRLDPKKYQIRVSEQTYEELIKRGNLLDTFDSVIQKLLTTAEDGLQSAQQQLVKD
jgi:hypothetical protein